MRKFLLLVLLLSLLMFALPTPAQAFGHRTAVVVHAPGVNMAVGRSAFVGHNGFVGNGYNGFSRNRFIFVPTNASLFFTPAFVPGFVPSYGYNANYGYVPAFSGYGGYGGCGTPAPAAFGSTSSSYFQSSSIFFP